MRRRTISVFLSLMLCLSLLSACGTMTDVPTNGSNRDIAFEETQQEERAEGSDSTTSENGESASDPSQERMTRYLTKRSRLSQSRTQMKIV